MNKDEQKKLLIETMEADEKDGLYKTNNMKQSIGEEVVQWAEKYWHIDKVCKNESTEEGEQFNYEYFRRVLIEKIESEIKDRLFSENNVFEKDEKYSLS